MDNWISCEQLYLHVMMARGETDDDAMMQLPPAFVRRKRWSLAVRKVLKNIRRSYRFIGTSLAAVDDADDDETEFLVQQMVLLLLMHVLVHVTSQYHTCTHLEK